MGQLPPPPKKKNKKNHNHFRNPIIYQTPSDALDKTSNDCIPVNDIEQIWYRYCLSTYGLYRIYYIPYAICEQKINSGWWILLLLLLFWSIFIMAFYNLIIEDSGQSIFFHACGRSGFDPQSGRIWFFKTGSKSSTVKRSATDVSVTGSCRGPL